MTVHRELGCGFLEAVYREALQVKASRLSVGLLLNFANPSLDHRRFVLQPDQSA